MKADTTTQLGYNTLNTIPKAPRMDGRLAQMKAPRMAQMKAPRMAQMKAPRMEQMNAGSFESTSPVSETIAWVATSVTSPELRKHRQASSAL